jgi:hypothetical protein
MERATLDDNILNDTKAEEVKETRKPLPEWQLANEVHEEMPTAVRDKGSPVWDMSQERAFFENLTNQRFTFFIVFFCAIVAGVVNAKSEFTAKLLLTLGSILSVFFAAILWRSHKKFDLIFSDLKTDKTHPATVIDRRAGRGSVRWILGWGIPWFCCAVLVIGSVLAFMGRLPSFAGDDKDARGTPFGHLEPKTEQSPVPARIGSE